MDKNRLQAIGDGFRTRESLDLVYVFIFIAFIVSVIGVVFIYSKMQWQWRGRLIYWRKKIFGQAVSKDRVPQNLEVVLQLPNDDRPVRVSVLNLSQQGMFIKMNPPLPVGSNFRFLMTLGPDERVSGWGEVRWSQPKRTPYTPPGMGCRLYNLDDSDRLKIKKFLRKSG